MNKTTLFQEMVQCSGPQHFWHQGLVSWKSVFLKIILFIYFYFWLCWIFIRAHCNSDGKESVCKAELGSIPRLGRSPGERNGNPLHYSCLENLSHQGSPVKDSFSTDGVGGWFWKDSSALHLLCTLFLLLLHQLHLRLSGTRSQRLGTPGLVERQMNWVLVSSSLTTLMCEPGHPSGSWG